MAQGFDPAEMKLIQVMAATTEMISSIVRLLEEHGIVGLDEFANALEVGAVASEKDIAGSPFPRGFPATTY
jgi:hypothetical protein